MPYHKLACTLTDLEGVPFLNQQVKESTRKLNILDIILCADELVNSITNTDTFLSDHRIISASTCTAISKSNYPKESVNHSKYVFEKLDFNRQAGLS